MILSSFAQCISWLQAHYYFKAFAFCDRLQFEVLIFFFSRDSITIMKVKLLSTMHSRELYDASVFALYAIWFVDMTLHCAAYCCILNWMSGFYSINTFLLSLFHLLLFLSIVTTNELFKTVVAFFLFQTNHKYYNVMTLLSIQMKGNMQYTWNAMSEEESATNWKWLFEEKEYWKTMPLHNL